MNEFEQTIDWGAIVNEYWWESHTPIYVTADTYKQVLPWSELMPRDHEHYNHPQRPVLMGGRKQAIVYKHALGSPHCANGYYQAVVRRWIRRHRYTESDQYTSFTFRCNLLRRLETKWMGQFTTSYHLENISSLVFDDGKAFYVDYGTSVPYELPYGHWR